MNYLLAILALFGYLGLKTSEMTSNQQVFAYLNQLASIEAGFFNICIVLLGLAVIVMVIGAVLGKGNPFSFSGFAGLGCGCEILGLAATLFVGTGVGYLLTQGMISSFSPTLGVVETVKFWVCLILFIVIGVS